MKLGWEQPRRIARIRELNAEKVTATYPVPFQGALLDLPIRTIAIELPKYRLNNGRTEAAQLQYLAAHPTLSADLFEADLESDAAQIAQHAILSTMINEKDLLPYFREHAQEEPLIITDTGFVLNGNRRLCVFRTLFSDNVKMFGGFANVRVVILPSADEKDLDRLESRLQRERPLRADYSWYADAVKYRRRLKEFGEAELCAMEGVTKEHIVKHIEMLGLAEKYLQYRGKPSQYALLSEGAGGGDGRFAFEALVKSRTRFKDAEAREAFIYTCFAEMLDPKRRAYETIPKIAEHFDYVQAEMPTVEPEEAEAEAPVGSIEALFGKDEETYRPLNSGYVRNLENAGKVREVVESIVAERDMIKRDTKKQNFVYEQIRKGTTFLKEAFNGINEGTTREGVAEQLAEAQEYVTRLQTWASKKP